MRVLLYTSPSIPGSIFVNCIYSRRSRKCMFKILLSYLHNCPPTDCINLHSHKQCNKSFSLSFQSTSGFYNSHTFKWNISAAAQDIWKDQNYLSVCQCLSANQGQEAWKSKLKLTGQWAHVKLEIEVFGHHSYSFIHITFAEVCSGPSPL